LKKIFITGASGLLGRVLVKTFLKADFIVLAQYHKKKPDIKKNCKWLQADFSDKESIKAFLEKNQPDFADCQYLINNYGPITYKNIPDLRSEDFDHDFFHNVITAIEITKFFLVHSKLQSVVNIGFENLGKIMPYKNILSYAIAKNALLLITKSFARYYKNICFNMISPVSIEGARTRLKNGKVVSPQTIASHIYDIINSGQSGQHMIVE
jgi:NAD(P)-dependent dehydrogenase (short-subunit alcohol dehydrogenase family)